MSLKQGGKKKEREKKINIPRMMFNSYHVPSHTQTRYTLYSFSNVTNSSVTVTIVYIHFLFKFAFPVIQIQI